MSGREWKPGDGDIAFISWQSQSGRSGGSAIALRCSRAYDESHWRTQTFGEIADYKVTNFRPLAVIDPEDREQVERLNEAICVAYGKANVLDGDRVTPMQAALREFANPKPPKPDEPTGMGAVVEDAYGQRYVGLGDRYSTGKLRWKGGRGMKFTSYDHIAAVRVLSEGVQP